MLLYNLMLVNTTQGGKKQSHNIPFTGCGGNGNPTYIVTERWPGYLHSLRSFKARGFLFFFLMPPRYHNIVTMSTLADMLSNHNDK